MFTPHPDFNGSAYFDFTVSDSDGQESSASVTVEVIPVNHVPVVMNGLVEVLTGNATVIDLLDFVEDRETLGEDLQFHFPWEGEGSLEFINSHEVRFTPELGYVGEFDLWYQVLDADGAEEWGYLSIVVDSVETIDEAFVECDGLMI